MKRVKQVGLTRREVAIIRCLLYPRLRYEGANASEYVRLIKKMERLWKEELFTGSGERYRALVPIKRRRK